MYIVHSILENIVLPNYRFAVRFSSNRLENCSLVKNIAYVLSRLMSDPKHLRIKQRFLNLLSSFDI